MVTENHYRWDFIGLSTDEKPTPVTSPKVVDGSTFYCSDTSKLYVFCKDTWYEKTATGGGGTTYTAGDNITITDGVISATDTTYSNFTGTDGSSAGTAGLVPAPATTDAGKFLKADGTWDTAGGGGSGIVELTTADFDYPTTGTADGIALWKLPSGIYQIYDNAVKVYFETNQQRLNNARTTYIISKSSSGTASILFIPTANTSTDPTFRYYIESFDVSSAGVLNANTYYLRSDNVKQTTGTSTIDVMSQDAVTKMVFEGGTTQKPRIGWASAVNANLGCALGPLATVTGDARYSVAIGAAAIARRSGEVNIGSDTYEYGYNNSHYRVIGGVHDGQELTDAATVAQGNTLATSAPTTSTVGVLGQLYTDTTNMHTYQCTAISGDTYTWTQRW